MEITPENLDVFVKLLSDAIAAKNGVLIGALGVIGVVYILRKYVLAKVPFFQGKAGGVILVMVTSILQTITTGLMGGAALSLAMLLNAFTQAVAAGGGWKMIVEPLIDAISKKPDAAVIKAEAEKAGAEAAAKAEPANIKDLVNK